MAELIRETMEERTRTVRPKPHLGIFASGHTDTASLASEGSPGGRSYDHVMGHGDWAVEKGGRTGPGTKDRTQA